MIYKGHMVFLGNEINEARVSRACDKDGRYKARIKDFGGALSRPRI
jgi:hypothetical protein